MSQQQQQQQQQQKIIQQPSSTKIIDLDRQQHQLPSFSINNDRIDTASSSTTYKPINVHPSPYGYPSNGYEMPPPIPVRGGASLSDYDITGQGGQGGQGYNPTISLNQQSEIMPTMNQPTGILPRDIPKGDISKLTTDEQIITGYIPPAKQTIDQAYLQQYEKNTQRELDEYLDKHSRESKLTQLWESCQIPIFIGIMFFIFNLPIVSTIILKYLSFMATYDVAGNFVLSGLLFKSAFFGIIYYFIMQVVLFISTL